MKREGFFRTAASPGFRGNDRSCPGLTAGTVLASTAADYTPKANWRSEIFGARMEHPGTVPPAVLKASWARGSRNCLLSAGKF